MSLIDSFTGPKWQHKDPEVRKIAIEQLDDPEVLLQLVSSDPDPAVQSAALSRIVSPDTLDLLIETLPHALRQQARSQRLQQLLPGVERLAAIDDDVILKRIISLCDDEEIIAAAMAHVSGDAVRMEIASTHGLAKVRLHAAQGIDNLDLLSKLMQSSRGRDKAVFRHCKTRVGEHQARQLAAAQQQEKIQQLCSKVQELATAADSKDYPGAYRALVAQWQLVKDAASPAQREQFRRNQASCAQRLVHLADARAAAQQEQKDLAAVSEVFPAIIAELQQIDAADLLPQDHEAVAQLAARLDDAEDRWLAAQRVIPASKEQTQSCRHYLQLWRSLSMTLQRLNDKASTVSKILTDAESVDSSDYQALQRQIARLQKLAVTLPWPESHEARMPSQISRLRQVLTQLKSQFRKLQEDQPGHLARTEKWLAKLRLELDRNHSKEADRAFVKASRILKSLAPKQRQKFEQEMGPLAVRLKEVDDWRNFAVEPKKAELCVRMSALIGSQEDVEVLAAKITFLQDEWKQLGALPHARDQALWNEFKAAADEAWKPCKAAFAEQAALRRENFAKRMQLVAQLTEYEEKMAWPQSDADAVLGESPALDWRMVQKTLDTARAAFRRIEPVDRKSDRISHKAFRGVCDRIYGHIKQEYARNISSKEQLVTRARALAAVADLPQAIDTCKKLQREWKAVGLTPVAADRKLWKAFRAACDAVFARVDEQRLQNTAELEARVKQAESLCDQARALLVSIDDEHGLQLNIALSGLKQQLDNIDLPPRVQQRLAREFREIEGKARALAIEIRSRREQADWSRLLEKIRACALKATDEDSAARQWRATGDLPRGIDAQALENFWQQGPSEGLEEQLRDACIGLEVLGGIESPVEDNKARMDYQMRRLVATMGKGKPQDEPTLEKHINGFVALRPSAQWVERFCSTLENIRG